MHDKDGRPSVCVVVPVYKRFDNLEANEIISLTQCIRVLHNYPVTLAAPHSLDWSGYKALFDQYGLAFRIAHFSDHFFEGIDGYNELMMDTRFYKTFGEYEYMLIYQTDCFVFSDELAAWCKQGYDYVGAPWTGIHMPEWFQYPWYPKKLVFVYRMFRYLFNHRVGNGGLSLRKISSFVRNLQRFKKGAKNWKAYEDGFFSHYVGTFNPFFRIPATKQALAFSFDSNPEKAYQLHHRKLPFGCHAWFRSGEPYYEHNLDFWEPFIQKSITQYAD